MLFQKDTFTTSKRVSLGLISTARLFRVPCKDVLQSYLLLNTRKPRGRNGKFRMPLTEAVCLVRERPVCIAAMRYDFPIGQK
jgi:hypothetical protein